MTTPIRLGAATGPFLAYGRAVEQLRADVAGGPHWYLAGIGVDPAAQRQGVGSALLRPGVEAAAAGGLPAVLLTNNEANLPFYESHGFAVVRRGSHAGGRPECLGYGQNTVTTSLPKRFPDRDEIAAVHAEADALETGAEGDGDTAARRARARAP